MKAQSDTPDTSHVEMENIRLVRVCLVSVCSQSMTQPANFLYNGNPSEIRFG